MSKTEGATYTHGHHASVLRSHTWRTAANSAAYLLPPSQAILQSPRRRLRPRHNHRRPGRKLLVPGPHHGPGKRRRRPRPGPRARQGKGRRQRRLCRGRCQRSPVPG
ncbi:uncharacterized protein TrAtP1_000077 [Trichoderma atroviride]|uniref:uncharacterized protein n=1 Tax=Hypocrea atroviridis TaxID=63577 RepID=UPI00332789AA|nr:hypothetical protein TrAtP1_000077 [Trichoderma atroviride]